MSYRVIVPFRRRGRIREVSYPGRGQPLYTREKAIEVLRTFGRRSDLLPYAESDTERFDLDDVEL